MWKKVIYFINSKDFKFCGEGRNRTCSHVSQKCPITNFDLVNNNLTIKNTPIINFRLSEHSFCEKLN